ncbi:patatin-like phospholipase domain-containing protein [Athelia psychrophila]|uniref:Patatin-like phospholipase domain-containing protein n=1 Tax=Athelia psychrophila TaxID=1759441 RepID=A0A166VSN9_9AGAM|nr:patatin-like phospholipase domain-containing protein [Fibularhizoctonia sp. CBS 109695]
MSSYSGNSRSVDLDVDYVVEEHIQAFAKALQAEDIADDPSDLNLLSPTASAPQSPRVRKVSALSDFAPVNQRVRKRRKREKLPDGKRQDWLFVLLRWPLLIFIFAFIAGEFGLYVLIRQLVNGKEWLLAWRGRKGVLRKQLRAARTYEEWKKTAAAMDEHLQFQEWKQIDEDPYYDWRLVRKVRRSLKALREKNDVRGVLGVLETCIRTNFAAVESPRLYSETFYGTKTLIESFLDEQHHALEFIRNTPELSTEEKKRFFKSANTNLGSSALCLSGGGSFGYYHFGVIKAFLDANLLPRVITGTSAGGLIAALVCTRTDAELRRLIVPEIATRITACEEPFTVWFKRFWKTGARFDSVSWARKCTFFTRGSMTFREAYTRTGRILNISVIPADRHSPTKLLNYMTAPDTIIWSALLASAAVPGILNPVVLLHKLKDGRVVPWNWGSKFKDGSLRVDIPVQALNLYFNVTHPIVSQVNPHVHLFFFAPRGSAGRPVAHRKGKGWRGNFLLSAAEQWLKLELTKNFKVIRDLELLPPLLGQDWSSVFLQRFDGAVTIWPKTRAWDWVRILSDPDPVELERMMRVGELVTWPKLHMIENRYRIEKEILRGRQHARKQSQAHPRVETPGRESLDQSVLLPRFTKSPAQTDNESPLPIDTDAEAAYANNLKASPKRPRPISELLKRDTNIQDPLRSPLARRRWASELLDAEDAEGSEHPSQRRGARRTSPSTTPKNISPNSSGIFSRFRTQSFPAIRSPFSGNNKTKLHVKEGSVAGDEAWSTDSSSDEEFSLQEQRHLHHPSVLNLEPMDEGDSSFEGQAE